MSGNAGSRRAWPEELAARPAPEAFGLNGALNDRALNRVLAHGAGHTDRLVIGSFFDACYALTFGSSNGVLAVEPCSGVVVTSLRRSCYWTDYGKFTGRHVDPPGVARQTVAWFLSSESARGSSRTEPRA